jgi:NAD(P)-dependent dehydrogenase (short-subunit alcohol dehydrogenase family)
MSPRLKDKIALIFGAGSIGPGWGNGKATAVTFARQGAKVVCIDVGLKAAEETVDIIAGEGGTALALACDVTKSDQVKSAVDHTLAAFGRIDVLHNNVGHAKMGGPVELTEAEWDREIDLNLKGVFLACKHVLPVMVAQKKGSIINTSSAAGLRYVGYDYASYYTAKGGVNQLTVGLALQYASQGIRVNAICPGLMDTPMIYNQINVAYGKTDEMVAKRHAACPTGRMGTGWDVANAALYLASDEAEYINAVILPVDGGLTARAV